MSGLKIAPVTTDCTDVSPKRLGCRAPPFYFRAKLAPQPESCRVTLGCIRIAGQAANRPKSSKRKGLPQGGGGRPFRNVAERQDHARSAQKRLIAPEVPMPRGARFAASLAGMAFPLRAVTGRRKREKQSSRHSPIVHHPPAPSSLRNVSSARLRQRPAGCTTFRPPVRCEAPSGRWPSVSVSSITGAPGVWTCAPCIFEIDSDFRTDAIA